MDYEVIFPAGMASFGGSCSCRLFRLSPESSAFILQNGENGGERLLLADVRHIGAAALPVLSEDELAELGCMPDELAESLPDDVVVLCRMSIPQERPQDAGYDMGRLVFVNMRNRRAMEAERPGSPVIPLVRRA